MLLLCRPAEFMRQAIAMAQCVRHEAMGAPVAGVTVQVDLHGACTIVVRHRRDSIRIMLVAVMTKVRRIRCGLLVRAIRRRHSPGGLQRQHT